MRPSLLLALLTGLLGGLLGTWLFSNQSSSNATSKKETAYERVMRTGVLRCAYGLWEPGVMRDPTTEKFSGFVHDIMQEVGAALSLKVEYVLEVDWGQIPDALRSGKADAHCAGIWATPARGRYMAFSEPISFIPAVAFVRAGDKRFDNNPAAINNPNIVIATVDDDVSSEISGRDFPKAKKVARPQLAPVEELLLMVKEKKADITFDSYGRLRGFKKSWPGAIEVVPMDHPLRIFPSTIAVDIHEDALLHMINTALNQLHDQDWFALR
jgi:ABC-type amino acid transport substrate-binding protein